MSAILRLCFLLLCSLAGWAQALSDCKQVLLVTAPDWNQAKASLQRYQRQGEQWQRVGRPIPVILGRKGLAWGLGEEAEPADGLHKKEGDNRSPAGVYQFSGLWLRKGVPGPPPGGFAVHRIQADTVGVDDPKSGYYNRILRSSEVDQPDWDSWEKMDISDYDRVLVISHNVDRPKPGEGSCIFMHRWDGPDKPTSGCTAMAERDLITLINWLRPESKPRLVQLTRDQAAAWSKSHQLP